MTWRTHLMGGITALWLLPTTLATSTTSVPLALLFAVLGSLLPDLDARESKLSNVQLGGVTWLKPAARLAYRRLGHRGAMHSLLAALVVAVAIGLPLAAFLDPLAGLGLVLGYLSHLVLDGCTRSGVPLLWPQSERVKLLPKPLLVTTGSQAEDLAFLVLTFIATAFLLGQLSLNTQLFQPALSIPSYEPDSTTIQASDTYQPSSL